MWPSLAVLLLPAVAAQASKFGSKPNILMVVVDGAISSPLRSSTPCCSLFSCSAAQQRVPANWPRPQISAGTTLAGSASLAVGCYVFFVCASLTPRWPQHNPEMKTPNANALVKEGIQLDKSYVFMYCAPTRSSIMSGRTPFRVNQILFGMNEPDWDMPSEMTAMPKKMKLGGYATHMVGKVRTPHDPFSAVSAPG